MCGGKNLTKTVELTPTPPGNDLLTKEEIEMFEKMVSMGPIMVVPGGTVGRNNMLLN